MGFYESMTKLEKQIGTIATSALSVKATGRTNCVCVCVCITLVLLLFALARPRGGSETETETEMTTPFVDLLQKVALFIVRRKSHDVRRARFLLR